MKTRVISSLFMLPLVAILVIGGKILSIACAILALVSMREFFNGFKNLGIKPVEPVAYGAVAGLYAINFLTDKPEHYLAWVFASVLACLLTLFDIEKRKIQDSLVTMAGILYILYFSFHVVKVEQMPDYGILMWLIFISAFGTDIMAYFSGFFFGKHKLCEKISPKKTVEGAVGGVLGSVAFSALFAYFFASELLYHCIAIGLIGSIVSQFGDLTASIFKRNMGIKDYGNLIPGHGGVLDRIDSVLFTAPIIYYYIVIFIAK